MRKLGLILFILLMVCSLQAAKKKTNLPAIHERGVTNTLLSPYAKVHAIDMDATVWGIQGFLGERFNAGKDTMLVRVGESIIDSKRSGVGVDSALMDEIKYHWFQSCCSVYAITKNPSLKILMDRFVSAEVASSQTEWNHLGNLLTASCIHYRATGEKMLLNAAIKATDNLFRDYKANLTEWSKKRSCPSFCMGIVELYRTTRSSNYLELAKGAIEGLYSTRSNDQLAGIADLYMETGTDSLLTDLNLRWEDEAHQNVDGNNATLNGNAIPGARLDSILKTSSSDVSATPLMNSTDYNLLWSWRMFELSGYAKYMDKLEQYLYRNGGFQAIVESQQYAYSLNEKGLLVNLYGDNVLNTKLMDGSSIVIKQSSAYPANGKIRLEVTQAPKNACQIMMRIPGWCVDAGIWVKGIQQDILCQPSSYVAVKRDWKVGDVIELQLEFPARLN